MLVRPQTGGARAKWRRGTARPPIVEAMPGVEMARTNERAGLRGQR